MNKQAQMAMSDLGELVSRLGTNAARFGREAGSGIKDWYAGLNPEFKATLLRGALGAAAGGGGLALLRKLQGVGGDEESILPKPGMGALLGALGAAGLPLGLKMMSGDIRFSGERPARPGSRALDRIMGHVWGNLPAYAGLGVAGQQLGRLTPTLANIERMRGQESVARALKGQKGAMKLINRLHAQIDPIQAAYRTKTIKPKGSTGFLALTGRTARKVRTRVRPISLKQQWAWGGPRHQLYRKLMPHAKGSIAAIPTALLAGAILNRYWRGET